MFIGVAILGPFVARPVSRLLGAPLAVRGTTGQLGQQNAMRNPSRTAVTAAALMVGVTLVSLTAIVASSVKASVGSIIDSAVRADFVVTSGLGARRLRPASARAWNARWPRSRRCAPRPGSARGW